jgi:pyrroline-5-carboxylate reductase
MPNTPALVGKGITGAVCRAAVNAADRAMVENVIATTGEWLWVAPGRATRRRDGLSGSGPAYMFFFLEAMPRRHEMGLTHEQAYKLAVATFIGASSWPAQSDESPEVLRQRVTSKGGTTYAAITSMEDTTASRNCSCQSATRGATSGRPNWVKNSGATDPCRRRPRCPERHHSRPFLSQDARA